MKKIFLSALFTVILVAGALAQIERGQLGKEESARIISQFTANEASLRDALRSYVFNRRAIIQTIGLGGQVTGEFRRDSFMNLRPDGVRFEKILFAPMPTTPPGLITPEDLEDLNGVNAFALDPANIPQYDVNYIGKEKIDELDLFVFDVSPKVLPNPKKTKLRLFTGRVWVDDKDLVIVKTQGKGVPETKENKFPVIETFRENVEGKYWFPSFSTSDDTLQFDNGTSLKLKIRIKYTSYSMGKSEVRILDEEEAPEEKKPGPAPSPSAAPAKTPAPQAAPAAIPGIPTPKKP
jgi:hypothetical protein